MQQEGDYLGIEHLGWQEYFKSRSGSSQIATRPFDVAQDLILVPSEAEGIVATANAAQISVDISENPLLRIKNGFAV